MSEQEFYDNSIVAISKDYYFVLSLSEEQLIVRTIRISKVNCYDEHIAKRKAYNIIKQDNTLDQII